jgi:hypothetical protein
MRDRGRIDDMALRILKSWVIRKRSTDGATWQIRGPAVLSDAPRAPSVASE